MPSRFSTLLTTLIVALLLGFTAQAQTFVTNVDDSGPGSLRQALVDVPSGGTIVFSSNVWSRSGPDPIVLTSGELVITKGMTIEGPSFKPMVISAEGNSRMFTIATTEPVTFSSLILRDGNAGGGFERGGAINAHRQFGSNLTVDGVTFEGNRAVFGGAISMVFGDRLTVRNSTFRNNTADGNAESSGGAIFVSGVYNVSVEESLFEQNTARESGAVELYGFDRTDVSNSVFAGNTSASGGTVLARAQAGGISGSVLSDVGGCSTTDVPVGSGGDNVFASAAAAASCSSVASDRVVPGNPLIDLSLDPVQIVRGIADINWPVGVAEFYSSLDITWTSEFNNSPRIVSTVAASAGTVRDINQVRLGYRQEYCFAPSGGGLSSTVLGLLIKCLTIDPPLPPVTALTATSADERYDAVQLTWTPPSVVSYQRGIYVYRRALAPGETAAPWAFDASDRLTPTPLSDTATDYTDDTAVPGTRYAYAVRFMAYALESDALVVEGVRGVLPPLVSVEHEDRIALAWPASLSSRFQQMRIHRRLLASGEAPNGQPGALLAVAAPVAGGYGDRTALPMQAYEYCLVGVEADQSKSTLTCTSARRVIRPVTGLAATQGTRGDQVRLTWRDASTVADRTLRVYRAELGTQDLADVTFSSADVVADALGAGANGFVDETAVGGVRYAYAVATVSQGVESERVRAVGFRAVVPAAVDLVASDGTDPNAVVLSWKLGEAFALSGFDVYRELLTAPLTGDGVLDPAAALLTTVAEAGAAAGARYTYRDETADASAYYEYCVVTRDASGGASAAVCDAGSRTGLLPPINLSATNGDFDDRVDLAWTDAGPDETGYVVSRVCVSGRDGDVCPANLTALVEIADLSPTARSYSDRDALQGFTYEYRVVATTTAGATSAAATANGKRADVLGPNAVRATDGTHEDRVDVSWATDATTAMVHHVYRGGSLIAVLPPDVLTTADRNVASDVLADYCVSTLTVPVGAPQAAVAQARADISALLTGASSNANLTTLAAQTQSFVTRATVSASTSAPGAAAPDGLTETVPVCDSGHRTLRAPTGVTASDAAQGDDERWVRIRWTDASQVEKGYRLYRWPTTGTDTMLVARLGPSSVQALDTTAVPGQRYVYAVRAYDAIGPQQTDALGTWGGRSVITDDSGNTVAQNEGRRELLAPTDVRAADSASETHVAITWSDNSAVTDGAGYNVYRRPAGTAQAELLVATVGPRATSVRDTLDGTSYGVAYVYRIAAFDRYGESIPSAQLSDRDEGNTAVLPPGDLRASMNYPSQIVLAWNDASQVNTDYRITRDGTLLATISDGGTYTDLAATTADHSYCVAAVTSNAASAKACATGRRSSGPPPIVASGFGLSLSAPSTPSGVTPGTYLGFNLAADGETVLASAHTLGADARGAAYVYSRTSGGWQLDQTLSQGSGYIYQGRGLAVSGSVALVTAHGGFGDVAMTSYKYSRNLGKPTNSTERYKLTATYNDGAVYVYTKGAGGWTISDALRPGGTGLPVTTASQLEDCIPDQYSGSIDLTSGPCADGVFTTLAYDAAYETQVPDGISTSVFTSGRVETLNNGQTNLKRTGSYTAVTGFGELAALDGSWAFATAPRVGNGSADDVYVYNRTGSGWEYRGLIQPDADIASIAVKGQWMVIGDRRRRAAHVYRNQGGSWGFVQTLDPGLTDHYGAAVSILGDRIAVGGYGNVARVYAFDGASFEVEQSFSTPPGASPASGFGTGIALSESDDTEFLVIGSDRQSAGYVYSRSGTEWVYSGALKGPSGTTGIGRSVALVGSEVAIGSQSGTGAIYFGRLGLRPEDATASDGTFDNRIQVRWTDRTDIEDGYRIYRSADTETGYQVIGTVGKDVGVFDDVLALPGSAFEYCVAAYVLGKDGDEQEIESLRSCDIGWLAPNGRIGGRIASREGASVSGVDVCLAPSSNRGLLLDGIGGAAVGDGLNTLPSAFTFEAWAKRSRTNAQEFLFSHGAEGQTERNLHIGFRATGDFTVSFWGNDVNLPLASFSDGYDATAWNHWAVTVDGADRQVYLNGRPIGGVESGTGGVYQGSGDVLIGARAIGQGVGDAFSGLIDDVRVWNGVRTPDQIADRRSSTPSTQADLAAYWPLDQTTAAVAPDITAQTAHLTLRGGAHWAAGAPGFEACRTTDSEGAYTYSGLRYGEGQTFEVRPTQEGRTFRPGAQSVSLSPESPVANQVDFTDASAFTFEGRVTLSTGAGADSVFIYVDDELRDVTKTDGTYRVSVQPTTADDGSNRTRTLRAERVDSAGTNVFEFNPATIVRPAVGNLSDLNFAVTTQRRLEGFVGGGCGKEVGTAILNVLTEAGRMVYEGVQADPRFTVALAPQRYLVEVVDVQNVPAPLSRADLLAFYQGLGQQRVDLTFADASIDLTYRAPIEVRFVGAPQASSSCASGLLVGERALSNVPIIAENDTLNLSVEVFERYGPSETCAVEGAVVSFVDGFNGTTRVDTTDAKGVIAFGTRALLPETTAGAVVGGVDRSYQRALTASAEVTGRGATTETLWAIIEGYHERTSGNNVVTAVTAETPLLVLHDPPGSNSSAFVEQGTQVCSRFSNMSVANAEFGFAQDFEVGFKSLIGFGVSVEAGGAAVYQNSLIAGVGGGGGNAIETCMTTTKRFETSDDAGAVGDDVYMGAGLNLLFALADRIEREAPGSCKLNVTQTLAADFDRQDPFSTTYVYSTSHIRDTLIPSLENLIAAGGDRDVNEDPREALKLSQSLENWRGHLRQNALAIDAAVENGDKVENYSWSANSAFSWSQQADTNRAENFVFNTALTFNNSVGVKLTIAGYDTEYFYVINGSQENVIEKGTDENTTETIGYTFSDVDGGDVFSVDVGTDERFGTPAFRVVGGRSSNPYESGTESRDKPQMSIFPSILSGIQPDDAATFELTLTNASESTERRRYVLAAGAKANPNGLVMKAGGSVLGSQVYTMEARESITVKMDAFRGPSGYSFRDVELYFLPEAEFDIWTGDTRSAYTGPLGTAQFSVEYQPPCSPVELVEPLTGWRINADHATASRMLTARGFTLDGTDKQAVGFQFRRDGAAWQNIHEKTADLLVGENSIEFEWTGMEDGDYEVRAYTRCSLGSEVVRNETASVSGIVDRVLPQVLGTPRPADGALDLGDDVTIRFTEALDCATVRTDRQTVAGYHALGIRDAQNNPIGIDAVCEGREVTLVPQDEDFWADHEGNAFTAFVSVPERGFATGQNGRVLRGLTDRGGNPLADAGGDELRGQKEVRWPFVVRRSILRFSPPNVAIDLGRGQGTTATAILANDDASERTMKIAGVPSWLSLRVGAGLDTTATDTLATLPADGRLPLTFDVADTLGMGRHTAEVWTYGVTTTGAMAVVDSSQAARLRFDVLVGCAPPSWQLDPNTFAYSMQMMADVRIPLSDNPLDSGLDRSSGYRTLQDGMLAAFVGSELRGLAEMSAIGTSMRAAMTVWGNRERGEAIRFEVYDPASCVRYTAAGPGASFASGKQVGSPSAPTTIFAVPPSRADGVTFLAGWTWFSLPFVPADASVDAILRSVPAASGDRIEGTDASGQQAFAQYDAGSNAWIGSLTTLALGKGYKLYLSQQAFLPTPASPVLPDVSQPVSLIPGWNWVGYVPGCSAPVPTVLAGLSNAPTTGDLLKSQRGFSVYDQAAGGWFGSLQTMSPGAGYQLRVAGGGSLTFPTGFQPDGLGNCAGSPVPPSVNPSLWLTGAQAFAHEMTLVVEVPALDASAADSSVYEVIVLVDDGSDQPSVRGVAPVRYDETLGRHLAYVTVGGLGESGEQVTLRLGRIGESDALHVTSDGAVQLTGQTPETLAFEPSATQGTPSRPLSFDGVSLTQPTLTSLGRTGIPLEFSLDGNAPNPARDRTTVRFSLPAPADVQMEVFDVLGRRVAILIDEMRPAGYHDEPFDTHSLAAGSYVVRVRAKAGATTHRAVHRVVVVR